MVQEKFNGDHADIVESNAEAGSAARPLDPAGG
jgi:hypothetical protein